MKVVIIEDEQAVAQVLINLLSQLDENIEIVAQLQSIEESVEWFTHNPMPELVFVDIHLADGSSFAIFDQVTITCPVVFTTAYDEYALRAFQVNSIDYLLKPIRKEDLERALKKFKNFSSAIDTKALSDLISSIKQLEKNYKTHFLIHTRDKLVPLPVTDIAYIYTENKLVKAVTFDEQQFSMDDTLEDLISVLDDKEFFRANRQYIVAHKAVKELSLWFNSKLSVQLSVPTPEKIIVSKVRVTEFKNWYTRSGSFGI